MVVDMVVISGGGHQDDRLGTVDARDVEHLVGWLGDKGMMLRGVAIHNSLGTWTLDWLAEINWLWCLTTLLLCPCMCHLPSCINII